MNETGTAPSFWRRDRSYQLDKMGLKDLVIAYFQYPAVLAYLTLFGVSSGIAIHFAHAWLPLLLAAALAVLIYPLAWYLIHRFVLHGRFLYRSSRTAALWKRIHYDHHQDPHDMRVLFGALYTTLPTIAIVTVPVGAAIGGAGGAAAAFAAGIGTTLFYEFSHCVQHLRYLPRSAMMRRIKRLHLMHHFRNERGNFGITNFLWDRLGGTYYRNANDVPRSETVFNLGYAGEERTRYPWVAQLSDEST